MLRLTYYEQLHPCQINIIRFLPQPDLLAPLSSLTHLTLSISDTTTDASRRGGASDGPGDRVDLPDLLRRSPSLRHLHARLNGSLTSQLHGELGHHLCNITISGPAAEGLGAGAPKVSARRPQETAQGRTGTGAGVGRAGCGGLVMTAGIVKTASEAVWPSCYKLYQSQR